MNHLSSRPSQLLIAVLALVGSTTIPLRSVETEPIEKSGLTVQLISEQSVTSAGARFRVGLRLIHREGFHTYWRSPGIVGLATAIEWSLPDGVTASPLIWPGPEITKMAQITAWGYEGETCLLTEIAVPPDFKGESLTLIAKTHWMCCAQTCHPGWETLSLEIPVGEKSTVHEEWNNLIEATAARVPQTLPETWRFEVVGEKPGKEDPVTAILTLPKDLSLEHDDGFVFFCDDNQINSDHAQKITVVSPQELKFEFLPSQFTPADAANFSGVVFHPDGWPGTAQRWIRVSAVWSKS